MPTDLIEGFIVLVAKLADGRRPDPEDKHFLTELVCLVDNTREQLEARMIKRHNGGPLVSAVPKTYNTAQQVAEWLGKLAITLEDLRDKHKIHPNELKKLVNYAALLSEAGEKAQRA